MSIVINGYEFEAWESANLGFRAVAKKNGKSYFIKRYQTPVEPVDNGALDAKTIAHNQKSFEEFVKLRTKINQTVRSISGPGGNIIIPVQEFVFDHYYTEISEFIPGVIPEEDVQRVIESLSETERCLIMKTAAGALYSVHRCGIIHSDLKPKNILIVKNSSNNIVAKLVDFDGSYFKGGVARALGGTLEYMSPEQARAMNCEDPEKSNALVREITEKSDVFSLGLIFHMYLTGEFPQAINLPDKLQKMKDKGRTIHAWVALSRGAEIQISSKITDPTYRALITDMLKTEPAERPSAIEVLNRLKEVGTKKTAEHSVIPDKTVGFPESGWPEHGIQFNIEKLQSRGFVSAKPIERSGIHGYHLFRKNDENGQFVTYENMISMGYAQKGSAGGKKEETVKKTVTGGSISSSVEPWPEHGIVFDSVGMSEKKVVRIVPADKGGVRGYDVHYDGGTIRFMTKSVLLLQKLAKTK